MFGGRGVQTVVAIAFLIALALLSQWRGGESKAPQPAPSDKPAQIEAPSPPTVTSAASQPSAAETQAAFDYYVLVLSWSPTHCSSGAGHGHDDDPQCRSGRPFGFVLHGLWPQNERGYPENCASSEPRTVAGDVMDDVLKVSPSAALVQHEWEKHGTCSGLSQRDYFDSAESAFRAIDIPPAYVRPADQVKTTPDDVREAFLKANIGWSRDAIAATCSRNELAEVWVCLDKSLGPRACSNEVRKKHCGDREVRMRAVRGDWPR